MAFKLFPVRAFSVQIFRRFVADKFDQLSASLAFTTLLSLVPLMAIFLGIFSLLPVFAGIVDQFDHLLVRDLLPERSAGMIIKYLLEFSQKAAHVTLVGLAGLFITVLFLLVSIERAFNQVWCVVEDRPWWKRIRLYVVMLVLWPVVVTGVVLAIYYAVTSSLGLVNDPAWLHGFIYKLAGFLVAVIFFAGLYFAVPNARVAPRDALWAGAFAANGFMLLQKGFEYYLWCFPSLTFVYGAFATVPIFLLWIYLSWAVVLLGALVAALLPEFRVRAEAGG
jgi:membrane protein